MSKKNEFNYCVIIYSDIDGKGCYSNGTMVEKNVSITMDDWGDYVLSDSTGGTILLPSDDETLLEK